MLIPISLFSPFIRFCETYKKKIGAGQHFKIIGREKSKRKNWLPHCSLIPLELSLKIKHFNVRPSFSRAISPQSTRILLYPSSSTTTNRKKIPWKVVKDWHALLYVMVGLTTVELPSANWIFSYSMFYWVGMLPQPQVPGQARTITLFVLARKALSSWIYSTWWWYSPPADLLNRNRRSISFHSQQRSVFS